MRKAFSPSSRIEELNITTGTHDQYIRRLRRKYGARNTRHLMYIRYERHSVEHDALKATERDLEILSYFVRGESYKEISEKLGITQSAIEKHMDKMKYKNFLQDSDELIVLYADWEDG
ncbi:MAG: LuxR C-terminal-related transcriptional regulator [Desulfovibrio sp.]